MVPVFTVCGIWTRNQNCQCLNRVCQPCQNVLPRTRIYRTNIMFFSKPFYKHYGLWWKFQPSGWQFTCLASHVCHFCAHEQLLLLCCKCNFYYYFFFVWSVYEVCPQEFQGCKLTPVSCHRPEVWFARLWLIVYEMFEMFFWLFESFNCQVSILFKWHLFVIRYLNSFILKHFIRNNSSVMFVRADFMWVRSVGMVLLFEWTELGYNQFLSRKV